jgi:hypothetical protein
MATTIEEEVIETEGETFGWVYPAADGTWTFRGLDDIEIGGHPTRRKAIYRLIGRADSSNTDLVVEAAAWGKHLRWQREQERWSAAAAERQAREAAHVESGGTVLGFLAGEIGL